MKKITVLIIAILCSFVGISQDIATARSQGIGANVTVTGIVTNGDELGPIRYIEDATAGLALYDPTVLIGVARGDEVTVSGILVDYNGLMEMTPVNSSATTTTGNGVTPQLITPIQIGEDTESELIQINNVIFNSGGSLFTVGTHDFSSNGEIGRVYIRTGSPLENSLIPMGSVTLIGISSQYTFSVPANDGYQILPRDSSDIIQTGALIFTSAVVQSNITTTSFDLSWTISDSSTTNCNFGLSVSLGTTINNVGNTLTHTMSLTGLQAATFYYVECYSVKGIDTAFSNIGIYSTASNSSGVIRPYFNNSVDLSVSTGVDAQNITTYFNDTIKAYMDLAQNTLDICVYNASDATIATAINDAYNRGVSVRYIADDDVANSMLSSLDPNIPIVIRDPAPAGIMHNKFIIVDANSTNNSWVMGGSTNWTTNLFNDYNNLIFIQDEAIAKAYTLEFEEMWGGVFGTNKLDNTPHKFIVNGKDVEVYFSPSDQTTSKIINMIDNVDYSFEFGLLGFTRDDLGLAVIAKDIQFGVNIRGIIEQENINGSEFANLTAAGVNVKSHQGVAYQFHHKYAIADANAIASDPTILTGSHNWSSNAENNSDENTIIIHDATIANIYLQEFTERFNELGTSFDCINGACIDPGTGNGAYASLSACQSACVVVTPTWDCDGQGNCSDPGTGQGTYASLSACQSNCIVVTPTWDCDGQGNCSDPGTGQGTYASLSACQSNCIVVTPTWDCDGQGNCSDPGTGQGTYASLSACQNNCIQTSVHIEGIKSLIIYPNPTDQIANIQFSITKKQSIKIRLINTIGEIIFIENLQNYSGDYSKKINLEGYSKGIYFIKIITEKGIAVKKIIIE